jgi:hypothetical protein
MKAQLAHDVAAMRFSGLHAEIEKGSDFLVALSFRE